MKTERKRLDALVFERGLTTSRSAAQALVLAGLVVVDGSIIDKAGSPVPVDAEIALKARPRFVSRAGEKLAGAILDHDVSVEGRPALDVGASTGGFVDCMLQAGARSVIALDVGRGQLDMKLRSDPRVVVMEGVNARLLQKGDLPYEPELVTMDVSFISVGKVLKAVTSSMADRFEGLLLVKPQFEAGPRLVGKKGIVRDPRVHHQVLSEVARFASEEVGLAVVGVSRSQVRGVGGNVEFFIHVMRDGVEGLSLDRLERMIGECVLEDDTSVITEGRPLEAGQ